MTGFRSRVDSFGRLNLCNLSCATVFMRVCTNRIIVTSQMNRELGANEKDTSIIRSGVCLAFIKVHDNTLQHCLAYHLMDYYQSLSPHATIMVSNDWTTI